MISVTLVKMVMAFRPRGTSPSLGSIQVRLDLQVGLFGGLINISSFLLGPTSAQLELEVGFSASCSPC